jgi:hypothetical protein
MIRIAVVADYLRLSVASTNIIIGTMTDHGVYRSSGEYGSWMIVSP